MNKKNRFRFGILKISFKHLFFCSLFQSNDPWGPSSTLMSEISDLTYNIVALGEIMRMLWKRLNDHGKNWRHVYKSLVLLDYLVKNGNEKVAQQCKEHIVAIQTLKVKLMVYFKARGV